MSDRGALGEVPDTTAPPTCYRHTDRESYITCQRCGRTICPECQTPASVGVHCPECVREANASRPQHRTVLGGVVPSGDPTLVTKVLIGLCVVMYFVTSRLPDLRFDLAMVPIAYDGQTLAGLADGQYWRLVTPVLVHSGPSHLLVNMVSLWFIGMAIEPRLGRTRFLTLFVAGAVGGSAASYAFSPINIAGVGASGAIFAMVGALVVIYRRLNLDLRPLLVVIAINVVIGFLPGFNIDWRAHFGGLVTGLALGAAFAYAPRDRRTILHVGAVVAMVAVSAVVVAVRTIDIRNTFGL